MNGEFGAPKATNFEPNFRMHGGLGKPVGHSRCKITNLKNCHFLAVFEGGPELLLGSKP